MARVVELGQPLQDFRQLAQHRDHGPPLRCVSDALVHEVEPEQVARAVQVLLLLHDFRLLDQLVILGLLDGDGTDVHLLLFV